MYKEAYSLDSFSNCLSDFYKTIANNYTNWVEENTDNILEWDRNQKADFDRHMQKLYGKAFTLYECYIETCVYFRNEYLEYLKAVKPIDDNTPNINTFRVLTSLNRRGIQVANEILILCKNGFADGAYARCRTLYEIGVIAMFISNHGAEINKSGTPVSDAFIAYQGDWYEWAEGVISPEKSRKKLSFADIERECGLSDYEITSWKNELSVMNKLAHASAQGTFRSITKIYVNKIQPIGPSDSGICIVATNTIKTLLRDFLEK